LYFSDCILNRKEPEPSGTEGLIDVKIIEALYKSAKCQRMVALSPMPSDRPIHPAQKIVLPKIKKPDLVHTAPMSN
jgi:hypothetical protein